MGRKISQFPAASSASDNDVLAGVQSGSNKKFSMSVIWGYISGKLGNTFVPQTRTINNKALTSNIALDASDVGAVDADDVGVADGIATLDSSGKVPSSQLPTMPSNVEANPSGAATDTLTKLQVDETIYAVSGGGGVDYLTVVDGKICVIYEV